MLQLRKLSNVQRIGGDIPLSILDTNANLVNSGYHHHEMNVNAVIMPTKNSLNNTNGGGGGGGGGTNNNPPTTTLNPNNLLGNLQFDSDAINTQINLEWINKPWIQTVVRTCAFCSFISICANTPETFKKNEYARNLTYMIDMVCTLAFTVEMLAKIKIRGLFRGDNAYIFDRWCQFDGIMVLFHIISVVLQSYEIYDTKGKKDYWSLFRCPRPLILIRVIRRSSSQIYNVTIFFLFFMALYGILGVQFFGKLVSHCVKNSTNPNDAKITDFMIPDTYCSPLGREHGYQCPSGMKCVEIELKKQERGFNGFDEIITSIFTVYEAASQEGWVFLMYRATDSLPSWRAYFYFFTMIFFLAWLVKNVFIAVIIETFAEIRVQFQQMWGARGQETQIEHKQVLERTDEGMKLVNIDDNKPKGFAPFVFQRVLKSSWFNMMMLLLVLANAIITATLKHTHKENVDKQTLKRYYRIEVIFTILFDLEVLFKVFCLGFKSYIKRAIYKFEFILALGTTLRLVPDLYHTELTYFQVLRIVRLIKSSPLLEDFVNKIFGPGKKLGSLIIFTMCLLIITSCVSMQLFCFIGSDEYKKFDTFDQALMSQFAIITNEGWTELMYDSMRAVSEVDLEYYTSMVTIYFVFSHMFCSLAFMTMFQVLTQKGWWEIMHSTMRQSRKFFPLVAVYFISYHLFVTLILLSLFVAVILDNLELEEDVKKIKQLKMREQSAETQETLPWRLRIFEKFPNQPQMVSLKRIPNEFEVPKIRESFMRQFLESDANFVEDAGNKEALKTNQEANNVNETIPTERMARFRGSVKVKLKAPSNLESITENPASTSNAGTVGSGNQASSSSNELQASSHAQMFRRGKVTTPNAHAAQLRVINNIRMQRACRYSIKKLAINNIVDNSNYYRLISGAGGVGGDYPVTGFGETTIRQQSDKGGSGPQQTVNVVNIGIPGKKGARNGAGGVANVEAAMQQIRPNPIMINANIFPGSGNGNDIDFKIFQYKKQQAELKRNQLEDDLKENHPYFDKPLFTIGRESNFRKFCQMIVEARYQPKSAHSASTTPSTTLTKDKYKNFYKFLGLVSYLDWIMIAMTIQSCIGMMFETPTFRLVNSTALIIVEYLFVFSMSIEMTLKVCAYGLFFTPNAVVKDFGGVLDLFIFTVSGFFLYLSPKEVHVNSAAHLLMLLRCLRPLRIFTLVPHMRKVIYELCRGFKEILLVSILLVVLIFIFANYGIQMYGGKLASCNDNKIKHKHNCTGMYKRDVFVTKIKFENKNNTKHPSIWVPRVWANPYNFNFDSIGSSMLALFEVLSLEGWLEVRDIIITRMEGTRHAIFVHVFVFIGTLIGLTLFVGVVITNYAENKGTALLTVDQRRWLDLKGRIKLAQPLHIPPRPENSRFRAIMFDITQHKTFKRFLAFLVLLNSTLLSVPWNKDDTQTKLLATLSAIFTFLFLLEAIMKSCALGPIGYWQSRRNRFDLFVTVLGIFWILMHIISFGKKDFQSVSNSFGFIVIVLRFFTIAGKHATLKMLMLTILVSFFKSFFIIVGMFLLMLVYAFAGVILFGCVKSGHDLGRHANFNTSPNAIVLLMRIVTGEEWNKIMHDCMIAPPACTKEKNYWESDCGNFSAALLYFCSFYVIITYIVLNLLVAIIMENFSLFYSNEEDALLSYSDIRHFQIVWNIVDTNRKGMIPCRRVKFLLRLLRGRLEVDLEKDRLLFKHMCYEIERLNNGSDVTFHDVLNMLSYRSVDIRKSLKLEELIAREELEYQIEEEVAKQTIRNWLDKCLRRMRERGRTMTSGGIGGGGGVTGGGGSATTSGGVGGVLGGASGKQSKQQPQSDIAIFKEQMGARHTLMQQQKEQQQKMPSPPPTSNQAINTTTSNKDQQYASFFPSPLKSPNIGGAVGAQAQVEALPFSDGFKSVGVKYERKEGSISSETKDNEQGRLSVTDLSAAPIKLSSSTTSKIKKRNTLDRQAQILSEEKMRKRNLFILESQSMTGDVKNWWKTTLNDIEL